MSRNNNNSNNLYVPGSGKNGPKQIHVAHRRSQSELTNLMIEQFTLQKQLEMVQAQQQQLLAQQHQLAQQTGQYFNGGGPGSATGAAGVVPLSGGAVGNSTYKTPYSPGNRSRSHSRTNSGFYHDNNTHRRMGSQSGAYGHIRRHSLGLNEAKKAAAEEQAKRVGGPPSTTNTATQELTPPNVKIDSPFSEQDSIGKQSGFKFPATSGTPVPNSANQGSHQRSNSNLAPAMYKFPATSNTTPPSQNKNANTEDDFIPSNSNNRRGKNRHTNSINDANAGINSNWRSQSQSVNPSPQAGHFQQQSPYRHRQTGSRDYNTLSTLEPPAFFQAGHKPRGSNSSVNSFMSNNGGNNNNANGRKSLFAPYLPQANIPELIQDGRLVAGILRVNKKNRSDAWVSTDGALDADIYICGSKDRNRALEGDLVAVELLVVDDVWESKKEKEEKKRRKDASMQQDIPLDSFDDYHNDASSTAINSNPIINSEDGGEHTKHGPGADDQLNSPTKQKLKRKGSLKQRPTQKKNDDVEVEGQSLLLVEEEEINDQYKPLYAGHVVAVLDRIPGQLFSGTLGLLRPSQQANPEVNKPIQSPKIAWFKPTDKKVPLIAIPTELAPKDFVENADSYADKLFVASIKRWPITSLHPFGILAAELGEISDPNTEIDSILRDNNFLCNEYVDAKEPAKEKTSYQPLPLPIDEYERRKTFSLDNGYEVMTITKGNEFTEFAVHLQNKGDETIEFGCHVVDVTAHIEEGSSIDRRARKRSSSVFMPQKCVTLLPNTFNKGLSLTPEKESAAISIIFELDSKTLAVKSNKIEESIIVPSKSSTLDELTDSYTNGTASGKLQLLYDIARSFYKKRIGNDDADFDRVISLFDFLDDEKCKPDLNILLKGVGLSVLDEIERKVDSVVAEKIYSKLGECSFLRRQMAPISTKLNAFKLKVQHFDFDIDTTSSETLMKSILEIQDQDARDGLAVLLYKTLSRARYFIAGKVDPDQYEHYALNLPLYTHFSSPMRRYADHVVHRQLKAVLNDRVYEEDIESLKITSEYCNFKKDCAAHAQEQAVHLLLCKTINDMGNKTGQLLSMATVIQVYESSFDIIIPEFGIEKRVHGDQLPLYKAEFDVTNRILQLHWQPGVDSATFVPPDEKNPKSYRNSIKNKFSSATAEIADFEYKKIEGYESLVSDELSKELDNLHIAVPKLRLPVKSGSDALDHFVRTTASRKENENCIQEVRELQKIPILIRAEIGMALPCLSVRALNPFMGRSHI